MDTIRAVLRLMYGVIQVFVASVSVGCTGVQDECSWECDGGRGGWCCNIELVSGGVSRHGEVKVCE